VTRVRYARIFWIGAAGALVLAALLGISALLRGEISDTDWQTLLTMLVLVVSAGTAVAGLTVTDRGHSTLGFAAVAVAGVAFFFIATAIWAKFDNETLSKLAGTAAFALMATLLGTTQLVLHRGQHTWVVVVTWAAALVAFVVSASALWSENSEDTWQIAASFWIIAAVGWLNLPVLQRFSAAGTPSTAERVVAALDDIELVATRSANGIAVDLAPGERLLLRRRSSA
jgi:mannitol-specific phosphotransferase system IIBC component